MTKEKRTLLIIVLILVATGLSAGHYTSARATGEASTGSDLSISLSEPLRPSMSAMREGATTVEARPSASSVQADWFVIVGSFKDRNNADKRAEYFTNRGYDVNVTSTNEFVNWADDLWAVVMGPYTQKTAKKMMSKVRSFDKNVYIKRGIVGG